MNKQRRSFVSLQGFFFACLCAAVLAAGVTLGAPVGALAAGGDGAGASMAPSAVASAGVGETSEAATDGILVTVEDPAIVALSVEAATGMRSEGGADAAAIADAADAVVGSLSEVGIEVTDLVEASDGQAVFAAEAIDGQSDEEAARAAAQVPGVVAAQPNYVYYLIDAPQEDAFVDLYSAGLGEEAGEGLALYAALRANDPYAAISSPNQSPNQYWLYNAKLTDAWNESIVNKNVTIAVLDALVMPAHEDLKANVLTSYAWDATTNRAQSYSGVNFLANSGHGTYVAGIAAGVTNNGIGIAGSSYNASILPVCVFTEQGQSSTVFLRNAFARVIKLKSSGALPNLRVINMSLGSYDQKVNDKVLHDYIREAREKYGIVTVCAGGNGYANVGIDKPRTEPLYPADFEECVAVTALTPQGTNVSWSDYNAAKDISAPGEAVWSTYPAATNDYTAASGSSSSSPMVAGTFALMFAAVPNATVDEACAALYATAASIKDPVNDRTQTSGSHGALDAAAAVAYLKEHHPWQFLDVPSSAWFYPAVGFVAERGILNGYADGSGLFGASAVMTREQAASMLYNYLGHGAVAPAAPQRDVKQGEWYDKGVNWAVSTGAMNGYTSSLFGVGDRLTREQAACIIANVAHADTASADPAKYNALQGTNQTSDWARASLMWAVDKGVLNGIDNGDGTRSLAPLSYVTRAQMAGIMMNAIQAGIL